LLAEVNVVVDTTVVVDAVVTAWTVLVETEVTCRSFELPERYPAPALTRIATNRIPATDELRI